MSFYIREWVLGKHSLLDPIPREYYGTIYFRIPFMCTPRIGNSVVGRSWGSRCLWERGPEGLPGKGP